MTRSYRQYCGLARTLDVVGDRWNLLIVRQLLVRPSRYGELLNGLPGLATNLLAARLRDLEALGVVERRLSDRPNAIVYALTPWGAELREPIEGLIRWATPLMVRGPEGDTFRGEWLVVALRALLAGKTARRPTTVVIHVDDQLIGLRITPEGVEVHTHDGEEAHDAIVRAEPSVILGLAAGMLTFDDADTELVVEGDDDAVRTAFGGSERSASGGPPGMPAP